MFKKFASCSLDITVISGNIRKVTLPKSYWKHHDHEHRRPDPTWPILILFQVRRRIQVLFYSFLTVRMELKNKQQQNPRFQQPLNNFFTKSYKAYDKNYTNKI